MGDVIQVAPQGRHLRALTRRIQHLERRVDSAAAPLSYDLQELEALRVARAVVELYRSEQTGAALPTSFLLDEAAARLLGEPTTLKREVLVQALHQRALLIESLGGT